MQGGAVVDSALNIVIFRISVWYISIWVNCTEPNLCVIDAHRYTVW